MKKEIWTWFEENKQSLIEAIPVRHSVRKFLDEPLPDNVVEKIAVFINSLHLPFEHSMKAQIFRATPGNKLYNNGINPVNNIAFLSETDLISISKTGFFGELVMLYAVGLGLHTCWFGHYKLSELGKYIPDIATKQRISESAWGLGYGYGNHVDVGQRVICCMPFGIADANSKRIIDLIMRKKGGSRKPLQVLLEKPETISGVPENIKDVLDMARLAPSAGNSQMWRFGYDKDNNTISVAKPTGYKHFKWEHSDVDTGICAAHIWLGLLSKGYEPQVEVCQDEDRAFWKFKF